MANFDLAIPKTLKYEGGYSNDPDDHGKETYRGISRKHHPEWAGWVELDKIPNKANGDIFPELEGKVYDFYRSEYWDKYRMYAINNQKVAGFVFDWIVNSGKYGRTNLQKVLGVTVNGIIGDKTIKAANNYQGDLLSVLKSLRIQFVKNIVVGDPSQRKFLAGWLNRINSF